MNTKIISISKNDDFLKLLNGKKISNKYTTIFYKKIYSNNSVDLSVGLVAKKKLGNAVLRNKIKRRLKNIMNEALKKLKINKEYSYLFMAKKNVFDDEYILIKKNIFETLEKVE